MLLIGALVAGAIWQWYSLAQQRLDLGGPLDDGAVLFAHAPEQSSSDSSLTFRWLEPRSELRLAMPPSGQPPILSLRAFPPQAENPPQVAIRAGNAPTETLQLAATMRRYHLLVGHTDAAELAVVMLAPRTRLPDDPRPIGFGLDWVTLTTTGAPTPGDLFQTVLRMPDLVIALLLLGLAMLLLQAPLLLRGLVPLLAVGCLAACGLLFPDARPRMLPYLTLVAWSSAAALLVFRLLQRARRIPSTDRQAYAWILAAYVLVTIITFVPSIKGDGMRYYAYLRSLTLDGDLQFTDEFTALDPQGFDPAQVPPTDTGLVPNNASVGPAIAWAPTYMLAHLLALIGPSFGLDWLADGYSRPYIVLVSFGSCLAGLITMCGSYRIARRWVDPASSTLMVLSLLLGSNLLYYAMREGSFAHSVSAATATLYVLAWLRLEEHPSLVRWAALGAAAGGVAVTYWIGALTFVLPLLSFVRLAWLAWQQPAAQRMQHLGQLLLGGVVAALLALVVFLPQMLAWWVVYGSPLVIPHGGDYVRPRNSQALRLLFSHLYGLLPWTPAFFAGMIGLPLLRRRSPWLTIGLLLSAAAYFFYNASLGRWYAGGSFGLRRLTLLSPWFAIGLALLLDRLRQIRPGMPIGLVALMSAWAIMLLVRYDFYLIPHLPEDIEDMPRLAFYLSREVLPFWALQPWLSSGFLAQPWYGFVNAQAAWGFGLLAIAMILSIAATFWMIQRIERHHSPATRYSSK
ncbi:MAG: hypothetical protein OHK0050_14200 [Roseiflexaceae bacterium]